MMMKLGNHILPEKLAISVVFGVACILQVIWNGKFDWISLLFGGGVILPWYFDEIKPLLSGLEATIPFAGGQLRFMNATRQLEQVVQEIKQAKEITKVSECNDFWTLLNNENKLYIFGLNGGSFLKEVERRRIRVEEIRIIAPTAGAINEFYDANDYAENPTYAKRYVVESIISIEQEKQRFKQLGLVGDIDTKRYGCFPNVLFCIASGKKLLLGSYQSDPDRKGNIGIRGYVWHEPDKQLVQHFTIFFENTWARLPK